MNKVMHKYESIESVSLEHVVGGAIPFGAGGLGYNTAPGAQPSSPPSFARPTITPPINTGGAVNQLGPQAPGAATGGAGSWIRGQPLPSWYRGPFPG